MVEQVAEQIDGRTYGQSLIVRALLVAQKHGEASNQKGLTYGTYRFQDYSEPSLSIVAKEYRGESSIQVIFQGKCVFCAEDNKIRTYIPGEDWENKLVKLSQS